jgi:hypothetical protein
VLMTMIVSHCVRTARDAPLTAQMLYRLFATDL